MLRKLNSVELVPGCVEEQNSVEIVPGCVEETKFFLDSSRMC